MFAHSVPRYALGFSGSNLGLHFPVSESKLVLGQETGFSMPRETSLQAGAQSDGAEATWLDPLKSTCTQGR